MRFLEGGEFCEGWWGEIGGGCLGEECFNF